MKSADERAEVSQYGITWTFDEPRRVGRFVNGDWWVMGPVTVVRVTPTTSGWYQRTSAACVSSGFSASRAIASPTSPAVTSDAPLMNRRVASFTMTGKRYAWTFFSAVANS